MKERDTGRVFNLNNLLCTKQSLDELGCFIERPQLSIKTLRRMTLSHAFSNAFKGVKGYEGTRLAAQWLSDGAFRRSLHTLLDNCHDGAELADYIVGESMRASNIPPLIKKVLKCYLDLMWGENTIEGHVLVNELYKTMCLCSYAGHQVIVGGTVYG